MRIPKVSYLAKRFNELLRPIAKQEGVGLAHLYADCLISFFLYGSTVKDYTLYKFYQLNSDKRKEFLTGNQLDRFYKKNNNAGMAEILRDKEKSLIHFADFIHRDWCGFQFQNTKEEYQTFAASHSAGIVKPLFGNGGHGIEIVKMTDFAGGG